MHKIGIAIVGAGQVGSLLAEELLYNAASHYRPICFVDRDKTKIGNYVCGLRVYSEDDDIIARLGWIQYNNRFTVRGYKFDGEKVVKVADSLTIKPSTGSMELNLLSGGTYVFVDNYTTVKPSGSTGNPQQKPNASTGGSDVTASVVALFVMAAAAVVAKKVKR